MVTKAKKALLASLAAFLCVMLTVFGLSMSVSLSETAKAADETYGVDLTDYVVVGGIKGFEEKKFASFEEAYNAIKPTIEKLGLGQESASATDFDAIFTDVDKNGNAKLTYTIKGNVVYDETSLSNLLTMGRRASHYGNDRHLIKFAFVGITADKKDTLTVNSDITLPYEWWGEKGATSISFENLTITGSAPSGLYPSQPYFEGIDFTVNNCTLKGIKIYNCSNVGGSYTITNSVLDGTGAAANAYAIHLQGNETAPLTINISGNTISGYDRGVNIDQATANATISDNTISVKDAKRSCIQLTQLAETTIADNNLNLEGGNAITLHSNLAEGSKITVKANTIAGNGYLIYDNTQKAIDLTYGENTVAATVDMTKGVYGDTTKDLSDDVYNEVHHVLAEVNGVKFATLAEAIAAAKDGETVKLLADATEDVVVDKNITLDLGGNTLTGTNTKKITLTIAKNATATVKNGSVKGTSSNYTIQNNGTATFETLTATAGNTGSSMIDNWGTLTITSGTYTGGLNTVKSEEGTTLTITGGKFVSDYAPAYNVTGTILAYGTTTISGGEFIQNSTSTAARVVVTGLVEGYTSITNVTGGSFTTKSSGNIFHGLGKATSDNFKVSGGTFNKVISADYCAEGFIPSTTKNADGMYGVKEGKYVAKVGSTKYETLAEAIAAAKDGDTVTLLDNITLTEQLVIGKNLTIDLGGFTLTSNYSLVGSGANIYAIVLNAAVTIKNGKIVADNARVIGAYRAMIMDGVTVENGIIGGHATIGLSGAGSEYVIRNSTINGAYSVSIFANNATVTITDCKLIGRGNTLYHNGSNYGLKLTVTGTEISSSASCGVYISGSTEAQSNTANQNGAGGYQQATFTRCTISGTNGIEVKYTNLTLNSCSVSTTENTPSYKQENNGPAASGFAVVSTDNAMGGTTPAPKGTIVVSGEGNYVGAIGIGTLIKNTYEGFEDASYAVSGGKFNHAILPEYCADGFIPTQNEDGTFGVKEGTYVAEVNGVKYETLQAAFDAAKEKATVTLLANTRENVVVDRVYELTFDLNGFTLNGGTEKGKPALTLNNKHLTIKDSSAAQTGTIMREDTAENSGVSSHYVIDIQGKYGLLTFESGNVKNNSGVVGVKGASLVRVGDDRYKSDNPTFKIAGGTFTQDNFIVIKVDYGTFYLTGGELNSKNSYAIENWKSATVKGGTVNGTVASWTYSGGAYSTLTISGGTINGDVTSVNYGNATDRTAKVSVTGGTVNGELDTRSYDPATGKLTSINDAAKATIEVTGGTFKEDPSKYVVEESVITKNADRTFGVEKAYLAKVGDTSYYTMDEAFKAQTKSGETIVLLRDYTTGSTFNSGSIHRVVDLNGHTWTCTSTDTNSAAFEINYADVTLTVKNGKIISNTLVGLIPSAMGGTIKYDNAGLVFEGVEMTSNGSSGIETNGNNTNDSVTLINSTLNVPNGFGIYFPSSGTLTINNSKINAKTMGVQVCSGELNINAGSAITVTGDAVPKAENDGAIQDGAAISIVNRTGYKGLSNIVITGGTFTAKAGNDAIKAYDWVNKVESEFTKADLVAVSGGTFSSEVKKDYLADRFVVNQNTDGTYGVTAGSGFAGANVVVTESLAMKVTIANGTASKYVVVTYKGLDGIDKSVKLDTLTDGYYLFDRIMPQMIDVKFSFELYGENDVMLDRKANYSVVDYLAHIIASDKDSAAFRNVAASLIEYANRAKAVKGLAKIAPTFVKGDEIVDLDALYTKFVDAHKIPAKDTVGAISKGDGQVIYKAKVVFDDAYTLTFYTNDNEKQYTYKLDDKDIVFDENGEYTVNVLAQNITTKYVLTVYDKDSKLVQTVTYGVSTYCIRMQETETPQGELYVASYYYGVAVNQYGTANPNSVQG